MMKPTAPTLLKDLRAVVEALGTRRDREAESSFRSYTVETLGTLVQRQNWRILGMNPGMFSGEYTQGRQDSLAYSRIRRSLGHTCFA
jgi:hypothetical protein